MKSITNTVNIKCLTIKTLIIALLPQTFSESYKTETPNECIDWHDRTGVNYQGNVQHTKTGGQCIKWSLRLDKKSNVESRSKLRKKMKSFLLDLDGTHKHKSCRNPDGSPGGPWCYLKNPKVGTRNWDYCDVEVCELKTHLNESKTETGSSPETPDEEPSCGISCEKGYRDCTFIKKPPKKMMKIIGGTDAEKGQFPWHVGLYDPCPRRKSECEPLEKRERNNKFGTVFCGASILNKNFILTAAHCVVDNDGHDQFKRHKIKTDSGLRLGSTKVVALIGYHDRTETKDQRITDKIDKNTEEKLKQLGKAEILVFKFIPHNGYKNIMGVVENDIAVGRLENSIIYNSNMDAGGMTLVRPVCLSTPELETIFSSKTTRKMRYQNCQVMGWGFQNTTTESDSLQYAKVAPFAKKKVGGAGKLIDPETGDRPTCQQYLKKMDIHVNSETQLCGLDYSGTSEEIGSDTAQGDSGGSWTCPLKKKFASLVVKQIESKGKTKAKQFVQWGITSFGSSAEFGQGDPAVYTRVSSFVGWLEETLEANSENGSLENTFQVVGKGGNGARSDNFGVKFAGKRDEIKQVEVATENPRTTAKKHVFRRKSTTTSVPPVTTPAILNKQPIPYCVVKNSNTKRNHSELSLFRGEKIYINSVKSSTDQWAHGSDDRGNAGWFERRHCSETRFE